MPTANKKRTNTTGAAPTAAPVSVLQPGKKVILRPLKRRTWSGFSRFPKCQDTIIAGKRRGGYITGLTPDEARELEKKMLLPENALDHNSAYWKDFVFRISEGDTVLDMGIPVDVISLKLALQDGRVAKSVNALHESPKAEYVIYDETEDARRENVKIELEAEAMSLFAKMSQADQVDFLKLMGVSAVSSSPDVIKNKLYKAMKDDPSDFLRIAKMPNRETRLLIIDLVKYNILRVQGGHYMHGTVDIGFDIDQAVTYMNDPNNQDLRLALMEQLEGAKKLNY